MLSRYMIVRTTQVHNPLVSSTVTSNSSSIVWTKLRTLKVESIFSFFEKLLRGVPKMLAPLKKFVTAVNISVTLCLILIFFPNHIPSKWFSPFQKFSRNIFLSEVLVKFSHPSKNGVSLTMPLLHGTT